MTDLRTADELPLRELILEDFETHGATLRSPGFWALAVHRLGVRGRRLDRPVLRHVVAATHKLLSTGIDWRWGVYLPLDTKVGRRVHLKHFGSMLLHARSIGNDVVLEHGTTFGSLRTGHEPPGCSLPVIEDGVDLGPGACVMGAVTVGRGATVGPNTVVIGSVPAGATVAGVPSRITVQR